MNDLVAPRSLAKIIQFDRRVFSAVGLLLLLDGVAAARTVPPQRHSDYNYSYYYWAAVFGSFARAPAVWFIADDTVSTGLEGFGLGVAATEMTAKTGGSGRTHVFAPSLEIDNHATSGKTAQCRRTRHFVLQVRTIFLLLVCVLEHKK